MMRKVISWAAAAAILMVSPLVHASSLQSMYISKIMTEGEEVELLSHGPFTISAACGTIEGESRMRLLMTVTADAGMDEWVYGYPDWFPQPYYNSCVGTTAAGTTSDTCIVWSTGSGQGQFTGGYTSLSGYTVGFGGESTIGLHKAYLADDQLRIYHDGFTAEEVDMFPADCAISGELTYNAESYY